MWKANTGNEDLTSAEILTENEAKTPISLLDSVSLVNVVKEVL